MRNISPLCLPVLLGILIAAPVASALDFQNFKYGPYDYTNPEHYRLRLPIVESYHFNSDVESLRASIDQNPIGGHLLYTIRSFPNHHRALVSFTRLWEQDGSISNPPRGVTRTQTPDYVYQRAIAFAPTDGTVRLLYGIYLLDNGKREEAAVLFDQAAEMAPDTADINYNLGLMYLRVNQPKKADFHASRAYDQGHPLPGLRNQMISAGVWPE